MRIILDTDNEQNFVDLWNPEKNNWERYIKCEEEHKTTFETWQRNIKKLEEISQYVNTDKNYIPKHIKDYINNLLDKEDK